jgi:hypothetical protein
MIITEKVIPLIKKEKGNFKLIDEKGVTTNKTAAA